MQPSGGRGARSANHLGQRPMATSNRPITLGRSEVGLGLRRSTRITLSDGKDQGERSPSRRSALSEDRPETGLRAAGMIVMCVVQRADEEITEPAFAAALPAGACGSCLQGDPEPPWADEARRRGQRARGVRKEPPEPAPVPLGGSL
jgi:hypothetical protein